MLKAKIKEWFKRYAFAEVMAVLTALTVANLAVILLKNVIIAGFLATWGENLVFYSIITTLDLKAKRKLHQRLTFRHYLTQLRNTVIEFGPAEYLDSFLVRPFYLSFLPYIIPSYTLAILIGTILANVSYYIPVILSYEARKKLFRG